MNPLNELDLEEWELLPGEEFLEREAANIPIQITIAATTPESGGDQDPVSQEKSKDTEIIEMRSSSCRATVPQINGTEGASQFEEKDKPDSETTINRNNAMELELELELEKSDELGGLNILNWSLTGIGAICSFGMAAATVCIVIFSSHRMKNKHPNQNQKLQFQVCSDDKRIKQAVHHASKINEAISAITGFPITRAQINSGDYYDTDL